MLGFKISPSKRTGWDAPANCSVSDGQRFGGLVTLSLTCRSDYLRYGAYRRPIGTIGGKSNQHWTTGNFVRLLTTVLWYEDASFKLMPLIKMCFLKFREAYRVQIKF
jgi:hypothetical protein